LRQFERQSARGDRFRRGQALLAAQGVARGKRDGPQLLFDWLDLRDGMQRCVPLSSPTMAGDPVFKKLKFECSSRKTAENSTRHQTRS